MGESSAREEAKLPKPGGKSISTSIADGKEGTGPRHRRERLKSWFRKSFDPASLETPSTSTPHARLPADENEGLASGKKHEASSGSSKAQASHSSTPSTEIPFSGTRRDPEAMIPVAELWNHAYEQIREQEPRLIEKYEAEISFRVSTMVGITMAISGLGKVDRRQQMEVLVKQKLKEDEDGRWRIPLGDDRIAIRDLAGHVVSIIDWGKQFIGAALESSPYGSIAWAGVCLLLPLVLNPSKQRASNICGLEYISDLLGRCAMYEYAYHLRYEINRDGDELVHNELDLTSKGYKPALKELYVRILRFQAQSVCQLSRNLVSGGVRAMFQMDDWDALLKDIKAQEGNCQTFFDSVKDQEALYARENGHKQRIFLLLDKLEDLSIGIKGVRDKLEDIHFSDEERRCFETLRTSNYLARKDLNPERLSGTCNWFLEHPKYRNWTSQMSASRLLWVSADPGCGKSVLAKALVDQCDHGSVCYYFFKDDDSVTRSAAHAICAILHQICDLRPVLIQHVLPIYGRNGAKMVDLFEDLWSAFTNIIDDEDFGNVICILDAIDEYSRDDYKKLFQRLAAIATSSASIKILITSRPYTSIETALFHKTGLDKNEIRLSGEAEKEQSMIEREISFFVTSKVQEFKELRESNDIHDDVHEKLHSYLDSVKNRTYLWVSAVFNELEIHVDAPEHILMTAIKALPDTVDKAYENILEKSSNHKPILRKTLHVMLAAFRPLSLMEMNMILSVRDISLGLQYKGLQSKNSFRKWLRDLCGFFVSIIDDQLYFTHQTAREFLVEKEGYPATVGWRGSFQLKDSHTLIARICLDYLLLLYDGVLDATFEPYATKHWPMHCQRFEEDQSLADKVKSFLFQNSGVAPSFRRWITGIDLFLGSDSETHEDFDFRIVNSLSLPPTPFFLACNFGWPSVILVLMTFPDIDWNEKNQFQHATGLNIAAGEGHLEIVRLLLSAAADVNIQDDEKETALHLAVNREYVEIVKLLIPSGADVNVQGKYKKTALHIAVEREYTEIVEYLLTEGADVNIQDRKKETALHLAVNRGYVEIVKLLLTSGADVNVQDYYAYTALQSAAFQGHVEIVKLLLTSGADANVQKEYQQTALHVAVEREYPEIVEVLLTGGADVNIQDRYEKTALNLAIRQGHFEIVKLFLTSGADVNIQDHMKQAALHHAVLRGHVEIVKLLLTAEADIDPKSYMGTALQIAKYHDHVEIVEALSAAGAIDLPAAIDFRVHSSSSSLQALSGDSLSGDSSLSRFALS